MRIVGKTAERTQCVLCVGKCGFALRIRDFCALYPLQKDPVVNCVSAATLVRSSRDPLWNVFIKNRDYRKRVSPKKHELPADSSVNASCHSHYITSLHPTQQNFYFVALGGVEPGKADTQYIMSFIMRMQVLPFRAFQNNRHKRQSFRCRVWTCPRRCRNYRQSTNVFVCTVCRLRARCGCVPVLHERALLDAYMRLPRRCASRNDKDGSFSVSLRGACAAAISCRY